MSLYESQIRDNEVYLTQIVSDLEKSLASELNKIHGKNWDQKSWSYLINPWIRCFVMRSFCAWNSIKKLEGKAFFKIELDIAFACEDTLF